jgi:hypothetical protein
LEDVVYGVAHDVDVLKALRNRKSVQEMTESGSVRLVLDEIEELNQQEKAALDKHKKVAETAAKAGSASSAPASSAAGASAVAEMEVDAAEDVVKTLERSGMDSATVTMVRELGFDEMDKLIKMKHRALARVRTYITLIPEDATENKLAKAIADTAAGKIRGCIQDCGAFILPLPC